ncbi:hypothetical protein niasHT_018038 [Heterodera trifolii]|uniref:UBC core domain-containing protein n=1 Tax=Heterodera trifolii TaxID=157864 RepID=A0ABD2L7K9_9BILA
MGSIRSNNNGNGRVTASSPTAATTDEDGAGPVEEFSPPTTEQLNMRCTGVKRLLKEAAELRHANEMFCARPMEDNLFEWHFSVCGPPDSPYAGVVYHGRIVLPADYPMKPPNLILMTPNGRFETNKKICLSISGYHPETWLPSWSIRTALLAFVGFMPTHSAGALGGLECSREERRRLAIKSLDWRCATCGVLMRDALPALPPAGSTGQGQTERLLKEIRGTAGGTNKSTTDKQNGIETAEHRAPINANFTVDGLNTVVLALIIFFGIRFVIQLCFSNWGGARPAKPAAAGFAIRVVAVVIEDSEEGYHGIETAEHRAPINANFTVDGLNTVVLALIIFFGIRFVIQLCLFV